MKTIYSLVTVAFILLNVQSAFAQTRTVAYYTKGGIRLLSAEGAYYIDSTEMNANGGGTVTRFIKSKNTKVSQYTYSSFEDENQKDTLDGDFSAWYSNGKLSEKGSYKKNELHGKVSNWFDTGQLSYEKLYENGKLHDTLKGYYEDGAVRRIEAYKAGEMVEGNVFSKSGTTIPYFPAFVLPKYPGGDNAMMAYISRNVKYPKEAVEAGDSGLVLISFIVEKDGTIRTLEVIKSISNALDNEALRVVRSMPRWEPGLHENKKVPVRFTLPVRFAFDDEL